MLHPVKLHEEGNKYQNEDIYHWVKEQEKNKIYPYMKFNIKVDIVKKYTDEEYKKFINVLVLMYS